MLKLQVALITILIGCVAFISCERVSKTLEPVADDMVAVDDMTTADDMPMDAMMDMMKMMDSAMYMSWANVALPVPPAEVTNPAETGAVHGMGTRTVYINDIGAKANMDGTAYPAGTMIVKVIMDDANTFVAKKALMMKSDDPMYAGHNGWVYKKYARPSADAKYMQVRGSNLEDAGNGCHGCHAKAGTEGASGHDSVFVVLPMDEDMSGADMDKDMDKQMDKEMPEDGMPEHMPETDMDKDMPEAAASDPGSGDAGDTGDAGNGTDAGNGDAGPDADEEAVSIANNDVQ